MRYLPESNRPQPTPIPIIVVPEPEPIIQSLLFLNRSLPLNLNRFPIHCSPEPEPELSFMEQIIYLIAEFIQNIIQKIFGRE